MELPGIGRSDTTSELKMATVGKSSVVPVSTWAFLLDCLVIIVPLRDPLGLVLPPLPPGAYPCWSEIGVN